MLIAEGEVGSFGRAERPTSDRPRIDRRRDSRRRRVKRGGVSRSAAAAGRGEAESDETEEPATGSVDLVLIGSGCPRSARESIPWHTPTQARRSSAARGPDGGQDRRAHSASSSRPLSLRHNSGRGNGSTRTVRAEEDDPVLCARADAGRRQGDVVPGPATGALNAPCARRSPGCPPESVYRPAISVVAVEFVSRRRSGCGGAGVRRRRLEALGEPGGVEVALGLHRLITEQEGVAGGGCVDWTVALACVEAGLRFAGRVLGLDDVVVGARRRARVLVASCRCWRDPVRERRA